MTDSKYFTPPACAWRRPIGNRPDTTGKVSEIIGNYDTPARTKKGLPLGGIGAGNFMYNLSGSFGPWQLKPGRYEDRFLPQAAFHLRVQVGNGPVAQRVLATEDVLPAWNRLEVGQGEYAALFPKGWFHYKGFDLEVSQQFFSPIVKDNYRETSLPVGVFLFRLHNPTHETAQASVMFTFPNAPYTGPHNLKFDGPQIDFSNLPPEIIPMFSGFKELLAQRSASMARERKGLKNTVGQDDTAKVTWVLMGADSPENKIETQNSEWCIATMGQASYNPCWDGAGDGSDIWNEFAASGKLGNQATASASPEPAGAVALQATLNSGETVILPFALSWIFPYVEFGQGTVWQRRFTEYFPAGSSQAAALAREALMKYPDWLQMIDHWTSPIVDSPAYPDWLKQGALNELYYATFGGSFWENGCVTKTKKFGARPDQHLNGVMECQEYRMLESFDVRHHSSRTTRDLWPKMERDFLLAFGDFTLDSPEGNPPHDAGGVDFDPFFEYDGYVHFDPLQAENQFKWCKWSEFAPKLIQQSYRYYFKTKEEAFLREQWPALVRAYHFQKTTDTDGDGLTEMKSSEYRGNKLFNAVLWIGSLEMLIEMATLVGDEAILVDARSQLTLARSSAEAQFWNQELGYYQFNAENPDIMADVFVGQLYLEGTGLPPVLHPERMTSHYRQLFKRSVLPLPDTNGDGVGDIGAGNCLKPDSTPGIGDSEMGTHENEMWVGVSYAAAANMYHWGRKLSDGALMANALQIAWGVHYQTWRRDETAYWWSTPEALRINNPQECRALMYQRARAIWELLCAVRDPYSE